MNGFIKQIKENYLSIISLFIAVIALIHNNRLYQKAEFNRNIRAASFEILMKLGQLQQEVNMLHYDESAAKNSLITGWGYIALIGDLSMLMPSSVSEPANKLLDDWKTQATQLKESNESLKVISRDIDDTREAVIKVIFTLN